MSKKLLIGIIIAVIVIAVGAYFLLTLSKEKVYKVGIISGSDSFAKIADGFKEKMKELGYVEGKNIIYDLQKLNDDREGEKRVAEDFVEDKADLIFAFPTDPALAAKTATEGTNIPVVFAHAGLENANLVESVREPGGNITGTRFPGPDLVVKRFEFLMELAPSIKRLYIPYDKNYPNCAPALSALRPIASQKGVTLVELPVTSFSEVQADLQKRENARSLGIDAIQIMPELLMQSPANWALISKFASDHKLPLVGSSDATITTGSVFTYNVNPLESGSLAAISADKILRGIQAGTIPVITPEAYLKLNYKVAQGLGLTVPESLLISASEIIR